MTAEIIGEKCGVFGIVSPGHEAARLTHAGIFTLQHRGQEAAGIASSDLSRLYIYKDTGLVTHVFDEEKIRSLPGIFAIGHTRYATSGSSKEHAQPVMGNDRILAVAHNGNLPSTKLLENFLRDKGLPVECSNDTEMMTEAIGYYIRKGFSLEEAITNVYPLFTGAFCLVVLTKDKLAVVRDEKGIRPLSIGKLNGGYVVASETCALDVVNAEFIGDVKPGEMIIIDEEGMKRYQLRSGEQKLDIFEFVYFARPDSVLLGKSVYEVRYNFGKRLALESPVEADIVIPIPDSAIPAAIGFSEISKIQYHEAITKNRYIHRTFIEPEQRLREQGVKLKLNPIPVVFRRKRVILIDDSIVRGNTIGPLIKMLKDAGASEVHVRISSPPVRYPDYYGIDIRKQSELAAAKFTVPEICDQIGADSLAYLSYTGMINATGLSEELFNTSCFTGIYPIDIRERSGEIVHFPAYA